MQTQTTTEWAREHGDAFHWHTSLDNYEPVPRKTTGGTGWKYRRELADRPVMQGIVLEDVSDIRDAHDAMYLVDDGRTVEAYYVAAWHPEGEHVILHTIPTNYEEDGSPKMRADGTPVDFNNYVLGPRKAYHLKITMTKGDS